MQEKKILDMDEMMVDYAEMTSFNFDSLDYKQVQSLNKITESEYSNKPGGFKFGKFDVLDMLASLVAQKA